MARQKLNIKPKEDKKTRFDAVPFVEGKTEFQLKVLIKNIWQNIGDLANVLDKTHPEVAGIIDTIRDGGIWTEKQLDNKIERYQYMHKNGKVVMYDREENLFRTMDSNGAVDEYKALNQKEIDKISKAQNRSKIAS